jgi:hypothetical protein
MCECVPCHGNAVNAINISIWTYRIVNSRYISIYIESTYIEISRHPTPIVTR